MIACGLCLVGVRVPSTDAVAAGFAPELMGDVSWWTAGPTQQGCNLVLSTTINWEAQELAAPCR